MTKKAIEYFDNIIMPLIRSQCNDILHEASMMILGSVGLGNDDQFSDVEAAVYFPDAIWKMKGPLLQMALDKCLYETNLWKQESGSVLCVHPLSWLLDYQGEKILSYDGDVPWEELSFDSLFTMQENPIYYDPSGRLGKLRRMVAPDEMPEKFWKKALYSKLDAFVNDGVRNINKSVNRGLFSEAHILFGRAVQNLLETGFLACHRYYPYISHLRWAFGRLPTPISELGSKFDLLSVTVDWQDKLNILETIYDVYKSYIVSNSILPEIDFNRIDLHDPGFIEELILAGRFNFWDNPDWRDVISENKEKAVGNGYDPDQWGIFQLWGTDWVCSD